MSKTLRPQSILKHTKFKLQADPLQDAAKDYKGDPKKPILELVPVANNWHIKVYTNSASDTKNNGVIEAKMDAYTMQALLQGIELVAQSTINNVLMGTPVEDGFTMIKIENDGEFWGPRNPDKKGPDIITLSNTIIGLDDRGVYVSIRSKGRPEINFYVEPTEYHRYKFRVKGNAIAETTLQSALHAKGFVPFLTNITAQIAREEYISWEEEKQIKEQNKQNRGGFSNRGGQQHGGGYSRQQPVNSGSELSFDDDLPM